MAFERQIDFEWNENTGLLDRLKNPLFIGDSVSYQGKNWILVSRTISKRQFSLELSDGFEKIVVEPTQVEKVFDTAKPQK